MDDLIHDLVLNYNLDEIRKTLSRESNLGDYIISEATFNEAVVKSVSKKDTRLINILVPFTDLSKVKVVECNLPWFRDFLISRGVTFKKGYDDKGYKRTVNKDGIVLTTQDCVYRVPRKNF
jgi:hypothetical protein